jgi:hypothetical protein
MNITIPTPHGPVTLTWEQVVAMGKVIQRYESEGQVPTWHLCENGCCVVIHEKTEQLVGVGWVINQAGEAEQVEHHHQN